MTHNAAWNVARQRLGRCADSDASVRAKVLECFQQRWLTCSDGDGAAAVAGELCRVFTRLLAERGAALLPPAHDEPVIHVLFALLHGSEDIKSVTSRKPAAMLLQARQVRLKQRVNLYAQRLSSYMLYQQ